MRRSFLLTVHSVSGLFAGLFVLLMSLSGAALVWHEELDKLQFPTVRPSPTASYCGIDSCWAVLHRNFPRAQIGSCILPDHAATPYLFTVYDPSYYDGGRPMQVFLHPATAAILDTRGGSKDPGKNFMAWLSSFHNSFHAGKTGEWLLGFFALVFLLSLLTGFFLYRRQILGVLSFRRDIYSSRNLHQLVGVYALLFNLLIAFSGFWMQRYVFKKTFYTASVNYRMEPKPSPAFNFSVDSALNAVRRTYPAFTPAVIYFAQSEKSRTAVYGSRNTNAFIHSKKYADRIMLDSAGGLAKTAFVTEIPAADRYDIINAQLHYGRYGGWPVRLLYCVLGLSGAVLSITGFLLWLRKKKGKQY
ncbi:MAG: PepSY domain-containing protein [Chitinophagaceae bacterium]|nr:PepSY domain-containing protein [Chitinophagaceae bacterium]